MKENEIVPEIEVDHDSRIPKYHQIVNSIIRDIEIGKLSIGDRLPSINEFSEEYYLSRDTVEKAYNLLKEKLIISSVKGKGYYVTRNILPSRINVLFLLNKPSSYKLCIFNSFVNSLGQNARVDLVVYNCDAKMFLDAINESTGRYDYYVVMPHFRDAVNAHQNTTMSVTATLRKIPEDRLIILDNYLLDLNRNVASVHQDFKMDLYEALHEGHDILRRYDKLILVYPTKAIYPYPIEILQGFQKFCVDFNFKFEVLGEIYPDMDLRPNDAYIIIEESDLVGLMKQVRDQHLTLGKDVGVISYNDTPLKELLGITVVSTDFRTMGETASYMILKKKKEVVKNVFRFINRHSI